MSDNTDYGFDLDSILAEFSSDSGTQDTEPPKPARPARPVEPVKAPHPTPFLRLRRVPHSRYGAQPNRRALRLPHLPRYGRSLKKRTQENLILSFSGTDPKPKSSSVRQSPPCAAHR